LNRYSAENKFDVPALSPEVLSQLQAHDWPGNVRELENYCERLVLLSQAGPIHPELLPPFKRLDHLRKPTSSAQDVPALIQELIRLGIHSLPHGGLKEGLVDAVERELIEQVMQQCNHVGVKAADRIGINRNTLHKKLEEYKGA